MTTFPRGNTGSQTTCLARRMTPEALARAAEVTSDMANVSQLMRCFQCRRPTSEFEPTSGDDVPDGATLQPCVLPDSMAVK